MLSAINTKWLRLSGGGLAAVALALVVCKAAAFPPLVGESTLRYSMAPGPAQTSTASGRVKLQPKLVPGAVMRYQIQFQTQSGTTRSGSFQDPQGPSQMVVTWDATVRLEVLGKTGGAPATRTNPPKAKTTGTEGIRMRTTYEKSTASVRSDTPDPAAEGIEKQYAQLEGRSIELTLGGDGRISDVQGLADILTDENARKAAEQWMTQLSGTGSFPPSGIAPGQHWSSEQLADSMPLAGLFWRTSSTYLRNEQCRPANPGNLAGVAGGDGCAVILAELSLAAKRATKDPTPEEYRRNGLRSSGSWTGSGQSLSYISLENGWVVSATQSGVEQMDVTVSKSGGTSLRYAGTVRTHSSVSLVPAEVSAP